MRHLNRTIILLIIFLSGGIAAFSQDYSKGNALPLFQDHEILNITLRGDFRIILDDVGDERREHLAFLEYFNGTDTLVLNIKIETRGNFRRDPDNCVFPPLRLNFKKKQVVGTIFEGLDKVKLVTHCRPNSRAYRQYVMSEYLVYRVYNIVTDTSFRARAFNISYVDEPSGKKSQESFGFFIEPDDALEDRLGLHETKQKYFMQDSTQFQHMSRLAVFQYFIGNTDWAVSTLHNIKLFTPGESGRPYAIPYDFDWSGVINTVYARPLPRFELESVSDRLFRGYCRTREELEVQFEFFRMKKDEIYQLYESFEPLRKRQRKDAMSFYDDFYEIIGNEAMIRLEFMDNCLGKQTYSTE
jgi:hypothetical protein